MAGAAAQAAAPVEERSPLEKQSAEELLGAPKNYQIVETPNNNALIKKNKP